MLNEEVMSLLDHLYKQFPYSVSRWVNDNAELHITLKDNTLEPTKNVEES